MTGIEPIVSVAIRDLATSRCRFGDDRPGAPARGSSQSTREVLDLASRGVSQLEGFLQLAGARRGPSPAEPQQAGEHDQVLGHGEADIDRTVR